MGLSEDQKAMLRLLAQRGEQGYEDIAALKGLSVEEVRDQARAAVRQLEDEGLPPPAIPLEPSGAGPAATEQSAPPAKSAGRAEP
ncbi:MAG TPA: Lrp/AsnC family transcriptional regulator, partial [Solirubrobacterales bacterium]